MTEEWRPVAGFEGYEVSDLGRARSLPREIVARRGGGRMVPFIVPERILSPQPHGGSPRVHMKLPGQDYTCVSINRAVLTAFVGDMPDAKPRHINGDFNDCRLENLEWRQVVRRDHQKKAAPKPVHEPDYILADRREAATMLARGYSTEWVREEFGWTREQVAKVQLVVQEARRRVHQARTLEGARA